MPDGRSTQGEGCDPWWRLEKEKKEGLGGWSQLYKTRGDRKITALLTQQGGWK